MGTQKYRKAKDQFVIGVQLALETDGFSYQKWGGTQQCRSGDWLVTNNGDCYTISEQSFAKTYRQVSPGCYQKVAPVWASQAGDAGAVNTDEGSTAYVSGDYIVSNNADGSDAYAVSRERFEVMYELDE